MQAATNPPIDGLTLHPARQQILALRLVAYGISIEHLEVLNSLLLGGRMTFKQCQSVAGNLHCCYCCALP